MENVHSTAGLFLLGLVLAALSMRYFRAAKTGHFRVWGWAGLALILLAEWLLFRGVRWIATFFTPLAWTGYLLFVDALVLALRGSSRLARSPRDFLVLAFWSVPLWLIFEAYNLRLANWTYVGLPKNPLERGVGYVWSFATIWPAIYETADLAEGLGIGSRAGTHRVVFSRSNHIRMFVLGLAMVTVPVLLPARMGQYLFAPVWLGFVFLLDPINYYRKGRSLLGELENGQTSTLYTFLVAGLVCGIFWEFWNYWACAKWHYVFTIGQGLKVFEMPLPGYLGFPPFALECFVLYEFLGTLRRWLSGELRNAAWRQGIAGPNP